jgi:large subunit ribosomal protein L4
MSKAVVLDNEFKKAEELALPESYGEINPHNLYLYAKSYLASLRANSAKTKTRSEVRGGGRKPWSQKGRGGARAGSRTNPIWVGGGVAHGATNNRNYNQKVNRKQKKLALKYALNEAAAKNSLYVVDSISVESGKTKDAKAIINKLSIRDVLIVKDMLDENTFLAFRNLPNVYVIESNELNAYLASVFHSVIIEKSVFENIIKEG